MLSIQSWRDVICCWMIPLICLTWFTQVTNASNVDDPEPPVHSLMIFSDAVYLTPEQYEKAIQIAKGITGGEIDDIILIGGLTPAESEAFVQSIASAGGGDGVPSPVDEHGNALPPPVLLPVGNEWVRVPGTPQRPIKWKPKTPVPTSTGGQPSASWDNENGHWDVKNGLGQTVRVLPDGTVVDHDNQPQPNQTLPPPFIGIDQAIVLAFVGIGLVAIIIMGILILIFSIFGGWGLASDDTPILYRIAMPYEVIDEAPSICVAA